MAVVKKLSADEETRMEYDKHEMWRMDYAATMRNAARKGMERGLAEGMEKGKIETALEMFNDGFSADKISRYVKMPIDWTEKILSRGTINLK